MLFPYTQDSIPGTRPNSYVQVFRPLVKVRVIGPSGDYDILTWVDTGADDTVLLSGIPQAIGVTGLSSPVLIDGIGGKVAVRFGTVDLEIGDGQTVYRWSAYVGFYDSNPSPGPPVLGLKGFLQYFTAIFDGQQRSLELVPNNLAAPPSFPAL